MKAYIRMLEAAHQLDAETRSMQFECRYRLMLFPDDSERVKAEQVLTGLRERVLSVLEQWAHEHARDVQVAAQHFERTVALGGFGGGA